ncbi:MAG: hypothetical protein HY226_00270 [Candidatus Vogelbacteria bacterium]|nr:hypothetical protein [Candidatus Vogelbacteria bacterium]
MAIEKFSRRKSGFEEVEEDEDFDDLYESDKHTSLGSAYKSGLVETAIFEKADGLVAEGTKSGKIPETAAVVAKMHFYNVLRVGGITDEAMAREVSRINRLSEIEDLYSQPSNPLPTIGIEIEIPGQWLNYEKVEVLDRLKVPNRQELVGGGYLWEVRPDFSYSPLVQSRYLQELVTMEALPLETGKDGELHIKKNRHI